jgi:hypothetical protein
MKKIGIISGIPMLNTTKIHVYAIVKYSFEVTQYKHF